MKYQGKRLYVYVGWNGVILALDFDWRGKGRDIEFSLFWCSLDEKWFGDGEA